MGAIVSIIITTLLYSAFNILVPLKNELSIWEQFKQAFFVVGFSEELSKFLIVLLFAQRHKEFNEPFDGIVYAVMVSMGFAATENIMYVMQSGPATAISESIYGSACACYFWYYNGLFYG